MIYWAFPAMWTEEYDLRLVTQDLDLLRAAVRDAQSVSARSETVVEETRSLLALAAKLDTPILGSFRERG